MTEKAKKAKYNKKYQRTPRGVTSQLLGSAKARAKKKGREFALTWDWIKAKIDAGVCERTGIKFDNSDTEWRRNPRSASLHRVDSRRGYTVDNVVVVVWQFNMAVGPYDESHLEKMIEAFRAKTQEG